MEPSRRKEWKEIQIEKDTEYGSQRSRKITKCMVSRKPGEQGVSGRQVETKSTECLQEIRTASNHRFWQSRGHPWPTQKLLRRTGLLKWVEEAGGRWEEKKLMVVLTQHVYLWKRAQNGCSRLGEDHGLQVSLLLLFFVYLEQESSRAGHTCCERTGGQRWGNDYLRMGERWNPEPSESALWADQGCWSSLTERGELGITGLDWRKTRRYPEWLRLHCAGSETPQCWDSEAQLRPQQDLTFMPHFQSLPSFSLPKFPCSFYSNFPSL